jgi:hypothetical protein
VPLLRRSAPVDPRVVLELSSRPNGSAFGTLEGVPVELGRDLRLVIPVGGVWPGEIVSLALPRKAGTKRPTLSNRAQSPEWMDLALREPEVQAHAEALASPRLEVELSEDTLTLRWLEGAEGPHIRRTAREAVAMAQQLRAAMIRLVRERTSADAERRRISPLVHPAATERTAPQPRHLQRQLAFRLRWRLLLHLATVPLALPLLALASSGAPPARWVPFAVGFVAAGWGSQAFRCPRCGKFLQAWSWNVLLAHACRNCGLKPG